MILQYCWWDFCLVVYSNTSRSDVQRAKKQKERNEQELAKCKFNAELMEDLTTGEDAVSCNVSYKINHFQSQCILFKSSFTTKCFCLNRIFRVLCCSKHFIDKIYPLKLHYQSVSPVCVSQKKSLQVSIYLSQDFGFSYLRWSIPTSRIHTFLLVLN